MWLLSLLPDWVYHLITLAGIGVLIAAWVLKFIPFITTYRLPLQVGGVIAVLFGVWMEGGIANEAKWQAKVKEMEAKVAAAEAKSQETNIKIITKTVKKLELVRTRGSDIISYVDREVVKDKEVIKFVENCPIPQIIVNTHNAAALNQLVEEKK